MTTPTKVYNSWEELEAEFYKTHNCTKSDPDEQGAIIERWAEDNGYQLK